MAGWLNRLFGSKDAESMPVSVKPGVAPFETVSVNGHDAVGELMKRRDEFSSTGKYPFLIGNEDEFGLLKEHYESMRLEAVNYLELANGINVLQWIDSQQEEHPIDEALLGSWPEDQAPGGEISIHRDVLTHKVKPVVYIGLIPLAHAWELPAKIGCGGWNDCPMPEVQAAFFRRWQSICGAEIASISSDVVEVIVSRPPTTRDGALTLAREHYAYCYDIVEQGHESVSSLAASLLNSKY